MSIHSDAGTVPLTSGRALVIVDADEVILEFAAGFDRFLRQRELMLDFSSYRLHGNVRRIADNARLLDIEVTALLEEFREALDWLAASENAVERLRELQETTDIVVLSNITPTQAPARRRNFDRLGLSLPLLSNGGAKGPPVRALARRAGGPVFFMDDIPQHHASVAEQSPDTWRIHYVADARLRAHMGPSPHAHLWATSWDQAADFIRSRLEA